MTGPAGPSSTPTAVSPSGTPSGGAGYTGNPNDQQAVDAYAQSLGYTGPSMGIVGSTAPAGIDQATWDQLTQADQSVLQNGFTPAAEQYYQSLLNQPTRDLGFSPQLWSLLQTKEPGLYSQLNAKEDAFAQTQITNDQNTLASGSGAFLPTFNETGDLESRIERLNPQVAEQMYQANGQSDAFWRDHHWDPSSSGNIIDNATGRSSGESAYKDFLAGNGADPGKPATIPQAPPTPSSPAGQPSAPLNAPTSSASSLNVPAPLQAPSSSPSPATTDPNGMPSYSTTPTTPGNSLLNSTITPGPATDRYAIAQQEYNDWVAQSDPQFQASMRDSNRYAAAAGQIGSGQATNSIGDIQTQRENAMRTSRDTFLGNALTGSIDDAYKNVGIAQQQQGFQAGQQQTGFNQNVQLQELANSEQGQQYSQMMQSMGFNAAQIQQAFQNAFNVQQLSNSQDAQSFYQALEQEIQGSQGDPAQILAWISGQYARGAAA